MSLIIYLINEFIHILRIFNKKLKNNKIFFIQKNIKYYL